MDPGSSQISDVGCQGPSRHGQVRRGMARTRQGMARTRQGMARTRQGMARTRQDQSGPVRTSRNTVLEQGNLTKLRKLV